MLSAPTAVPIPLPATTARPAARRAPGPESPSLAWLPQQRAAEAPTRLAFRFLPDGTTRHAIDWTYADLAGHAATVAEEVRRHDLRNRRVVLALEPGLPFVAALFGIAGAGATAVPAFPPDGRGTVARFRSIVRDCDPDLVIADSRSAASPCLGEVRGRILLDEFSFAPRKDSVVPPVRHEPAIVQYSSGSTGEPKGIVLSHHNVLSNCAAIEAALGPDPARVGCAWLPPYHDMGLIGTILLAVYGGWPLVLLSPAHFAQRPYRWLKAITDHRATISLAPNFALDACVSTVDDEELATLDLTSLRRLCCGAEPVSPSTVDRFAARFAPCGYRRAALLPCYGLAEATLFVSGGRPGGAARTVTVEAPAPPEGRASTRVISCGSVAAGHEVVIADPWSGRPEAPGRIGEVWVRGPSVAQGYLGKPRLSAETFGARLPGSARTYLRTGDLGFLLDGELFITGRIKDLIVIAGRNLYPQDVERTAAEAHPRLRRTVAFSVDDGHAERLVVVAEFRGTARALAAEHRHPSEAVIAAVTAVHGVRPSDVRIVPVGAIPVTTSGKTRRREARSLYLRGTLCRPPHESERRTGSTLVAALPEM
ncbi:fatty acyl-AMP ligase [Amycolatopsis pigmentata]|uniref:Fatty acyl-AMP ligase n=1 Tax=Amycolatopsis pigmentata TaxID=450801 RepID=A0ABW5G666_9PSEU